MKWTQTSVALQTEVSLGIIDSAIAGSAGKHDRTTVHIDRLKDVISQQAWVILLGCDVIHLKSAVTPQPYFGILKETVG
jgi:hypothetical protein